jgi:ferric iron reductase protein FhuF
MSVQAGQLLNRKMRGRLVASIGWSDLGAKDIYLDWIERFVEIFPPPLLLADILLRRSPLTSLDRLEFIASAEGWVTGYKILGRDDIPHGRAFFRFEKLIFHHLVPLVDLWSERIEISQAAIWGSLAKVFNDTLQTIEEVSGLTERLIEAHSLLNEPIWPDGNENPLFKQKTGWAR